MEKQTGWKQRKTKHIEQNMQKFESENVNV